ncbi:glycosyltransferase family 39 protein [Phormidium tenue FACHB-886]|nr:glycosyltransferase family 39 protein [Phormidium tenue FACHB-886]
MFKQPIVESWSELSRSDSIAQPNQHRQSILKSWNRMRAAWKLLILACLILGLLFRLIDLDRKVYQYDETFTSLRVSGYTETEAVQTLTEQQFISVADLQRYQQPNSQRSVVHTIGGLAAEEPQLTPLYFVLTKLWASLFGGSIVSIRLLSAIFNLLALPLLWWLIVELFTSPTAAWLSVSLMAVSPFQMLYAHEARPQSLWLLMTIASSTLLLRAIRRQTATTWLLYSVAMTLNLYSFLFSGFVAVAHGIYLLGISRFRLSRTGIWGGLAIGLSLIAFLPWLLAVATNINQVNVAVNWTIRDQLTFTEAAKMLLHHLSVTFIDRGEVTLPLPIRTAFSLIKWAVRLLLLYGLYVLCRKAPLRISLFILTLTLIPLLGLLLPDLLLGGTRSTVPRYAVPFYLGLNLVLTFLLTRELLPAVASSWRRQMVWRAITITVLTGSVVSCLLIAHSDRWWSKMISNNNRELAQIINQANRPLVVSDAGSGDLFSLSHYLDPEIKLLVRPQCYTCKINRSLVEQPFLPPIPAGYSDVFLFQPRPTKSWLKRLSEKAPYRLIVLSEGFDNWLWKIDSKRN